jgi:nucleoside-diphosphate-sugar epimerase
MKKVLVTGGAGYLGSHVVRQLLQKGYQVKVLDNLTYGDSGLKDILHESKLEFIKGDICNIKDVVKAVKGCSIVIALAAIVGDPACSLNEEETINTNYESTKVLVEICKYYGVQRLLFASSCSVYGSNSGMMLNEGSWLNPCSLYAKTRVMSENVILQNCDSILPVILRLATLYGQSYRMRYDLVVNILSAKAAKEGKIHIFGGDQWRPLIHVRGAAAAFLLAMDADEKLVNREIYNVGSNGQNYRIIDIAKEVERMVPNVLIVVEDTAEDKRDYKVNFDKIMNLLAFKPKITLPEGIREMVKAVKTHVVSDYLNDIYYNVKYLYR